MFFRQQEAAKIATLVHNTNEQFKRINVGGVLDEIVLGFRPVHRLQNSANMECFTTRLEILLKLSTMEYIHKIMIFSWKHALIELLQ